MNMPMPAYLMEDCQLVSTGCWQLRSSDIDTCVAQRPNTFVGDRSFTAAGSNSLPTQLRELDITLGHFRRALKTHLFGFWQLQHQVTVFSCAVYKFAAPSDSVFVCCVQICLLTYLIISIVVRKAMWILKLILICFCASFRRTLTVLPSIGWLHFEVICIRCDLVCDAGDWRGQTGTPHVGSAEEWETRSREWSLSIPCHESKAAAADWVSRNLVFVLSFWTVVVIIKRTNFVSVLFNQL